MGKIITISGLPGSGKDTVGKMLQFLTSDYGEDTYEDYLHYIHHTLDSEKPKYKIKKIATPLKQCVCTVLGCTMEQLEDQEFKTTVLPEKWWYYKRKYGGITSYPAEDNLSEKDLVKPTVRSFLQSFGTEVGRRLHPNIWVNTLVNQYNSDYNWIITDLRFKSEYEALKQIEPNIISINIQGRGINNGHSSNYALNDHNFDMVIQNIGTLKELFEDIVYYKKFMFDKKKL